VTYATKAYQRSPGSIGVTVKRHGTLTRELIWSKSKWLTMVRCTSTATVASQWSSAEFGSALSNTIGAMMTSNKIQHWGVDVRVNGKQILIPLQPKEKPIQGELF